jgi:hypothetical protein
MTPDSGPGSIGTHRNSQVIFRRSSPHLVMRVPSLLTTFDCITGVVFFKQAAARRIPSFWVGACVRFDPRAVAQWLGKM